QAKPGAASNPGKSGKAEKAPKGGRGKAGATGVGRGAVTMERPHGPSEKPRLAKHYQDAVLPELMKKFGYTTVMQAPRFVKIVLNMSVGDALQDSKLLDAAINELVQITGQRPAI